MFRWFLSKKESGQDLPKADPVFLLFLDFDGVLHPGRSGTLEKVPLLKHVLGAYSAVRIVITSTWRQQHSLENFQQSLPTLADRIIDATEFLPSYASEGSRQQEIEHWLEKNGGGYQILGWLALDDEVAIFRKGCPNLLVVDGKHGFSLTDASRLNHKLAEVLACGKAC